ncbi:MULTISPECIES: TPM domain-containing protein [Desulfitobacterium]|uniref:Beta-propeller domain-containing protein, methanol dehydrogenase n=1 Tax=Desulfitobacterium dehalogenans (strain ATCC 51507 / DSM 9161 / JW/IU-DC1) TaxID=756499 RepID=I4AA91_DESDJ|nr:MULTISPECIES: TPM domain-containing protein [Desulfitobacterium]AFM00876.1 beta-propeller domain-containing protein, methanol dehydrogenase [Desulfitobacterium dehalogenans ATCC 51507]
MGKRAVKLALLLVIMLYAVCPTGVTAALQEQRVFDSAQLFTEDERASLEETSKQYGSESDIDIVIVTTNDLGEKTPQLYLEEFYDANGADENGVYRSAALLLLNMTPGARSVEIQGYGRLQTYLNNQRIESILDDITPLLADGNYYDAMLGYIEQAASYMQQEVQGSPGVNPGGSTHYDPPRSEGTGYTEQEDSIFFNTLFQLSLAVVIGAAVVSIMAARSGGRVTTNNRTYLDPAHSRLLAHSDQYIRTSVTKVRRPKKDEHNNNSGFGGGGGGFGGGGISPGGHSHSGGGRSF